MRSGRVKCTEEGKFCPAPSEVGFGNWEKLKAQVRQHWMFASTGSSDHPKELSHSIETLINLVEKEFEELDKGTSDRAAAAAAATRRQGVNGQPRERPRCDD